MIDHLAKCSMKSLLCGALELILHYVSNIHMFEVLLIAGSWNVLSLADLYTF